MTIDDQDADETRAQGTRADAPTPPGRPDAHRGPDPDLVLAMSPRQILGGFALLAALVMLLRRRNRDRDRKYRD
jgi:hypothetical protein